MEEMKNALASYFSKFGGKLPLATKTDDVDPGLFVSEADSDGYAEWSLKTQDKVVDFAKIEADLGFKLSEELKSFYSSYLFVVLEGKIGDIQLYFQPIFKQDGIETLITQQYKDGQYEFPQSQNFVMGSAIVGEDDGYLVCYDNNNQRVFCLDTDMKKQVEVSSSLVELFSKMEAL